MPNLPETLLDHGYVMSRDPTHLSFTRGLHQVIVRPENEQDQWRQLVQYFFTPQRDHQPHRVGDTAQSWCPKNSYWDFIPLYVGLATVTSDATFSGSCFNSYKVALRNFSPTGGVTIDLEASSPTSMVCGDAFMIASRYGLIVKEVMFAGHHTIDLTKWNQYEYDDVLRHGLRFFLLPCGLTGTTISLTKTVTMFKSITEEMMFKANAEFFAYKMNWTMPVRQGSPIQEFSNLTRDIVPSGSYLAVLRLDGLDPVIAWGIGGHTGHSCVAVWEGNQLWVAESTAPDPLGVYWPPPYGVIRTPWEQWVKQAVKAHFSVGLLPLSPKFAAMFDESAFWNWFKQVEGLDYGYANFLYTVLDTWPMRNLPEPVEGQLLDIGLNLLERVLHNSSDTSVYRMIIQGINKRLNTACLDMHCVNEACDNLGKTVGEVTAIPELDRWNYPSSDGRVGPAMVCSVFAMRAYKAGFGSKIPDIEGNEQTPKDNYMMNIFDGNHFNKINCPLGLMSAAPAPWAPSSTGGSYCQIVGDFELSLPGYNSIPLYTQMNDYCPSQWRPGWRGPSYFRCPDATPTCC